MFRSHSEDVANRVSGTQLQDDIMRFEGRFSAAVGTAFAPFAESKDLAVRLRAKRDELDFTAAALDIAVGTNPVVDLLDMITLVALGKDAMASRWNVDEHGEDARGIARAFESSLHDITTVARDVLPAGMAGELRRVITEWQHENPNQTKIAGVRLSAYAEFREGAAAEHASGLFSMVRGAAQTAETAVLLGERALYAAQRLPYLVRMQTRLGGTELLFDFEKNFGAFDQPLASVVDRTESSVKRVLRAAFITCSGIAVVAATSWFLARVAHARLVA